MADTNIKLEGDIIVLRNFLNPNLWNGNFEREMRKATMRNCLYLVREVKTAIKKKKYARNTMFTAALKRGSNTPLLSVEKNLWDAITYQLTNSFSAEIGVFNAQSTGGVKSSPIEMQKLATMMHEGYVITVTPKMRRALFAALRERGGGEASSALGKLEKMIDQGAREFRVPPRKFLTDVWSRPEIQRQLQQNWREALERAFKAQGAKGGEDKDK